MPTQGAAGGVLMDRLATMRVFVRVADAASFVRAAEALQLPAASVSRMVQALEAHLKVRLLNRSTRNVTLTDEGRAYYERCARVLGEIDEMEAMAAGNRQGARGRLKVGLPGSMAKSVLIPALPDFLARYPQIDVELAISDRRVNLIEAGVDCAIRVGACADPGLVVKHIGQVARITCASPAYLRQHGEPRSVADLARHVGIGYVWDHGGRSRPWEFTVNDQLAQVPMAHTVFVDDADAYLACGVAGLGIVSASEYTLRPAVRSGLLRQILHDYATPPRPVAIVFRPNRHMPQRLRTFIDWYAALYQSLPEQA
ncbi:MULTISPECIES: LysR family transcriptional regulator [unclassified Duganella]|uniref:LysR family transcriptional regulator n=1 Tax=unclassified Duganella TaxID=2636909 RepID=UPI000889AAEF|nr:MULTISPECIES: LysR family transcriptional regulator [unclassified Duganella]SDF73209.1 LysR family transcriptional regulator, regulator for bpeEF and oprC [Duganella sp. OV458]SDI56265.1 transcriptional regulator, LysR family [Duganella sp. OV510]